MLGWKAFQDWRFQMMYMTPSRLALACSLPCSSVASSQAKCRHCKEKIEKGIWRIRLVFFEEGRFSPGGFVHLACRRDYFENEDLLAALLRFSPALDDDARRELEGALAT